MNLERLREAAVVCIKACIALFVWLFLFFMLTRPAHSAEAAIRPEIRAIIGESAGEPFNGQVAVAECIRRRHSLKGVYGARITRIPSKAEIKCASMAWVLSSGTNYSNDAIGWGTWTDIQFFKQCKWFRRCVIVAHIGHHYFYKEK